MERPPGLVVLAWVAALVAAAWCGVAVGDGDADPAGRLLTGTAAVALLVGRAVRHARPPAAARRPRRGHGRRAPAPPPPPLAARARGAGAADAPARPGDQRCWRSTPGPRPASSGCSSSVGSTWAPTPRTSRRGRSTRGPAVRPLTRPQQRSVTARALSVPIERSCGRPALPTIRFQDDRREPDDEDTDAGHRRLRHGLRLRDARLTTPRRATRGGPDAGRPAVVSRRSPHRASPTSATWAAIGRDQQHHDRRAGPRPGRPSRCAAGCVHEHRGGRRARRRGRRGGPSPRSPG